MKLSRQTRPSSCEKWAQFAEEMQAGDREDEIPLSSIFLANGTIETRWAGDKLISNEIEVIFM